MPQNFTSFDFWCPLLFYQLARHERFLSTGKQWAIFSCVSSSISLIFTNMHTDKQILSSVQLCILLYSHAWTLWNCVWLLLNFIYLALLNFGWLCKTLVFVELCLTLLNFVLLFWTLFDFVKLCLTSLNFVRSCLTLFNWRSYTQILCL